MKNIITLLSCLVLTSCLIEGTDTGNPGIIHSNPASEVQAISVEMKALISTVCDKLNNCGKFSNLICEHSILNQTNIDTEIGLLVNEFASLNKVDSAIVLGNLIVSQSQLTQCRQDIDLYSCTDPEVENAFDINSPNPYEGVAEMLPISCETIL